jgi:hypothetical protein
MCATVGQRAGRPVAGVMRAEPEPIWGHGVPDGWVLDVWLWSSGVLLLVWRRRKRDLRMVRVAQRTTEVGRGRGCVCG